jgi:hypothetical protein
MVCGMEVSSKAAFAERLKAAMTAAGYAPRPAVLEREFNERHWGRAMTLHGVRRWLLGETLPTHDKLVTLAKWLGMQPHVLLFGEDAVRRGGSRRSSAGKLPELPIPAEERETIEAYLRLPDAPRRTVRDVIHSLDKTHNGR